MESPIHPIVFWNRASNRREVEQVYGDGAIRWLYGTIFGRFVANLLLSWKWPSRLYGIYQSSRFSQKKISRFILQFAIPMEEFDNATYFSFNEFFIRKFRRGAREFISDRRKMPAFCEARYLGFKSISLDQEFPVKGTFLTAEKLLKKREVAEKFEGGPMLIARLCPTDYHRFHFPDWGKVTEAYSISGRLHSVNPIALKVRGQIFATNARHVTLMNTENFGQLAYIEVGALFVGRIVQTHRGGAGFDRGAEKGYFLFGGSTVIVMGEKGRWVPDDDLLNQTSQGVEAFVHLGEQVGRTL